MNAIGRHLLNLASEPFLAMEYKCSFMACDSHLYEQGGNSDLIVRNFNAGCSGRDAQVQVLQQSITSSIIFWRERVMNLIIQKCCLNAKFNALCST